MKTKRQLQLEEILMWIIFWSVFPIVLGAVLVSICADKLGDIIDRYI